MNAPQHSISAESIVAFAEHESGAHGLADAELRQRVDQVVDWINERGPYSADQVYAISRQLQKLLTSRLRLALDRRTHPDIAREEIRRPIFVAGFPRSGTTLLHSLLAEDPDVLAPQSWHVHTPSPPPGAGPVAAERMAFAQREVEAWMSFCPGQKSMHPYIDKGAHQLCEDDELFPLDFRYIHSYYLYRMPTLEPMTLPFGDQASAYRFHRELLQHHQWDTGKQRWVCKSASAQHYLDALFEVYPDALCVWPHRPFGEIFASLLALVSVIYDTIQGRRIDRRQWARETAEGMKAAYDQLLTSELIDDPRVLHLSFRDLSADPVATLHEIYERYGARVSPEFERRARAWLEAPENRIDRHGRYPYSYEAIGLERKWIDELFADYSRHFGLDA